jgi:anti-sigma factor RsiW
MTFLPRSCRIAGDRIVSVVAGSLDQRERFALEAHADSCDRCAVALRDAIATGVALDRAFAGLRARYTRIAPGRVHLALRPAPARPAALGGLRGQLASLFGATARLAEATVALGVAAFILSSAVVADVAPQDAPAPSSHKSDGVSAGVSNAFDDPQVFFRWVRLGRYAPINDQIDPSAGGRVVDADADAQDQALDRAARQLARGREAFREARLR